jgi:hypothetical protein
VTTSIVRGKYVITRALDRHRWEQIDGGAVLQRDGIVVEIASYDDLRKRHPDVPVICPASLTATTMSA